MDIKPFVTEKAPISKNPISQALKIGNMLYVSGTGPGDPSSGKVPDGIEAQTHQVLKNLKAIVEEAGSSLDRVAKTTVFMKNIADASTMNAIYATYFPGVKPTRSCVEISAFGNPDWLLEIEVIALLESDT